MASIDIMCFPPLANSNVHQHPLTTRSTNHRQPSPPAWPSTCSERVCPATSLTKSRMGPSHGTHAGPRRPSQLMATNQHSINPPQLGGLKIWDLVPLQFEVQFDWLEILVFRSVLDVPSKHGPHGSRLYHQLSWTSHILLCLHSSLPTTDKALNQSPFQVLLQDWRVSALSTDKEPSPWYWQWLITVAVLSVCPKFWSSLPCLPSKIVWKLMQTRCWSNRSLGHPSFCKSLATTLLFEKISGIAGSFPHKNGILSNYKFHRPFTWCNGRILPFSWLSAATCVTGGKLMNSLQQKTVFRVDGKVVKMQEG